MIQMDEKEIKTIADIEAFLAWTCKEGLKLQGSTDDIYNWIERTMKRFRYSLLSKKEKLLVLRYLMQLSGYSRQQVIRLVARHQK